MVAFGGVLNQNFVLGNFADNKISIVFALGDCRQRRLVQPLPLGLDKAGFERKFLGQLQQFIFFKMRILPVIFMPDLVNRDWLFKEIRHNRKTGQSGIKSLGILGFIGHNQRPNLEVVIIL